MSSDLTFKVEPLMLMPTTEVVIYNQQRLSTGLKLQTLTTALRHTGTPIRTDKQADRQTQMQADTQTNRHIDTHTHKHTDTQTQGHADIQTYRHNNTKTNRHKDTGLH